jgi:hypothetical protein
MFHHETCEKHPKDCDECRRELEELNGEKQ